MEGELVKDNVLQAIRYLFKTGTHHVGAVLGSLILEAILTHSYGSSPHIC